MPTDQSHSKYLPVTKSLARALVASQFPRWSNLELLPVLSSGTDNTIFRIGENMCLRFPKFIQTEKNLIKEFAWLPKLTPLPLRIPKPVVIGVPEMGYPCNWCVFEWVDGDVVVGSDLLENHRAAKDIGEFISALQLVDTGGGPKSGSHNNYRGVPLIERDQLTREAILKLNTEYDADTLFSIWQTALDVPAWGNAPVWLHGDIHSGNMLTQNGHLNAVIDFGLSGVGDPACDLMVGWTQFGPKARNAFRQSIKVDDATWERGKGWALSWAVIALARYIHSNSFLAKMSRKAIDQIISNSYQKKQFIQPGFVLSYPLITRGLDQRLVQTAK